MEEEIIKITVSVSTDKVGSGCNTEIEFTRKEWYDMDEHQRNEACKEAMFELIEWDYCPSGVFKRNRWNS